MPSEGNLSGGNQRIPSVVLDPSLVSGAAHASVHETASQVPNTEPILSATGDNTQGSGENLDAGGILGGHEATDVTESRLDTSGSRLDTSGSRLDTSGSRQPKRTLGELDFTDIFATLREITTPPQPPTEPASGSTNTPGEEEAKTHPAAPFSPLASSDSLPPRPPRVPPSLPDIAGGPPPLSPQEDITNPDIEGADGRPEQVVPYSLRELYGRVQDRYPGMRDLLRAPAATLPTGLDQIARRVTGAFASHNMAADPNVQAIRAIHEAILPRYFGYDRVEDMPQAVQHNVRGLFNQLSQYMVFGYTSRGENTVGEKLITKLLDRLVQETNIKPLYRGGKWFAKEFEVADVLLRKNLPKSLSRDFHRFVNRELMRRPHYLVPTGKEGFTYSPAPPIVTSRSLRNRVAALPVPSPEPGADLDRGLLRNSAQDVVRISSGPHGIALTESGGPFVFDESPALIANERLRSIVQEGRLLRPKDLAKKLAEARREINRAWRKEKHTVQAGKEAHPTDAVAMVTTVDGRAYLVGESTGARVYVLDGAGHVVPVTLSPTVAELQRKGAIKTERHAKELQQAVDASTTSRDMQSVMVELAVREVKRAIKNGDRRVINKIEDHLKSGAVLLSEGQPVATSIDDVRRALINLQQLFRRGRLRELRPTDLQTIQDIILPSHLQHLWPIVHDQLTGLTVYPQNSTKNVQTFSVPIEPGWEVIISDVPAGLVKEVAKQMASKPVQVKAQALIQLSRQVGIPRQYAVAAMKVPRIGTGSGPLAVSNLDHHTLPYLNRSQQPSNRVASHAPSSYGSSDEPTLADYTAI